MSQDRGESLRLAILREPDADDLRLIYADWLDDHGDEARAQFIRDQVALAAVPPRPKERCSCGPINSENGRDYVRHWNCPHARWEGQHKARRGELTARTCNALRANARAWATELFPGLATTAPPGVRLGDRPNADLVSVRYPARIDLRFSRGFVFRVECGVMEWEAHGPAICGLHPITDLNIWLGNTLYLQFDGRHGLWMFGSWYRNRIARDLVGALEGAASKSKRETLEKGRHAALWWAKVRAGVVEGATP